MTFALLKVNVTEPFVLAVALVTVVPTVAMIVLGQFTTAFGIPWPTFEGMLLGPFALVTFTIDVEGLLVPRLDLGRVFTLRSSTIGSWRRPRSWTW